MRCCFLSLLLVFGLGFSTSAAEPGFRLATFAADVTVPMGHGMMGGSWLSKTVADPLEANGLVLLGWTDGTLDGVANSGRKLFVSYVSSAGDRVWTSLLDPAANLNAKWRPASGQTAAQIAGQIAPGVNLQARYRVGMQIGYQF